MSHVAVIGFRGTVGSVQQADIYGVCGFFFLNTNRQDMSAQRLVRRYFIVSIC